MAFTLNLETINGFLTASDHFYPENGIWISKTNAKVSFPNDAWDVLFRLEDRSFWFQHRNNCIVSLVQKYTGQDLFLDVGGGNGVVTKAMEDGGIPSVLVEPARAGAENARLRNVSNVVCAALSDLAKLKGKIPAIGAFDVIEHIKDDQSFVAEVNQLLMDEGLFYVTVPAYQFLWSDDDSIGGHHRRYSLMKIIGLLERNNFNIVYSTYLFSILVFPLFVSRTIGSRFGFHKTNANPLKEHSERTGMAGRLLNAVWRWERKRIQNLKSMPFGTSCLVVAKKKQHDPIQ